jgi:CheY-like chemotaxis protein
MMHIENLPFNVRELLDSVVTMMNVKAKSLNLFLNTEIADTIPPILKGDSIRLTQILINLISNALKFTHEGGVKISVDSREKNDAIIWIRFKISDTGIGIEAEKQRQIFERFRQAQPETTRRYGGTGLGLSIVKQLVEIQKGIISVSSAAGKGSVFTVELPYQVASESEIQSSLSSPTLSTVPVLKGIRILVAEDNSMNQKLLKHLLEQWQIDFRITANGLEAIDRLREEPNEYDILLMDIQMPEMDGYNATEKIRNDLQLDIPIIAMTAHALTGEKEKCLGIGMNDYISKPLNEEHLYKLILKYGQKTFNPETPIIDLEYLRTLSKGDETFEKNMIRSFSVQIPEELSELKSAIEQEDYKRISAIAHTMKSTVSYMGMRQIAPLLQQIEKESENKTGIRYINDNFALIDSTCQIALQEAKHLIS